MSGKQNDSDLQDQWSKLLPKLPPEIGLFQVDQLDEIAINHLADDFQDKIDERNALLNSTKKIKILKPTHTQNTGLPSFVILYANRQLQINTQIDGIVIVLTELCDFDLKQRQLMSGQSASNGSGQRHWKIDDGNFLTSEMLVDTCLHELLNF